MPTLFFMPWCQVRAPVQVGPITLLPYVRGKAPGPLGGVSQVALDGVLGNYADRAYHPNEDSTTPVASATILRWAGDNELQELLDDDEIQDRLRQTQLLVFAALSDRNFGSTWEYCNADGLLVTAQHFSEERPAATSVTTRRRDGRTQHMMSGDRGMPIFLRPLHVSDRYQLTMDWRFAEALLAMPDDDARTRVLDAAMLYNRANTDASEVPPAAEIVLLRAALETLLGATHQTADLKAKLVALMAPCLGPITWHDGNISPTAWRKRWPGEDRPISAWVRDFCAWRNKGAHGTGGIAHAEPIWSLENHLVFTSWFTSRLVKCLLATEGSYALTQDDQDELMNLEMFFAYDILAKDGMGLFWSKVLSRVHLKQLSRMLYEATSPKQLT